MHARHNRGYAKAIDILVGSLFRLVFRKLTIRGTVGDDRLPMLVIANHFSWWDGYAARTVNRNVFRRRFHVMMREDELRKRPFLTRLGAFSIRRQSKSALHTINYAATLLTDPENMVLLYPQGKFQSQHRFPLTFEKGWFRIPEKAQVPIRIVFMASLVDFFEKKRPSLTVYLQEASVTDAPRSEATGDRDRRHVPFADAGSLENAYNAFLAQAIESQERSIHSDRP